MNSLRRTLAAVSLGLVLVPLAQAQIYVSNGPGISSYDLSGAVIDSDLVSGFNIARLTFAVSGNDLFVYDSDVSALRRYDTSGNLINASFSTDIVSSPTPQTLLASGSTLYLTHVQAQFSYVETISATTGASQNAEFIAPPGVFDPEVLFDPYGIAVSGSTLLVSNRNSLGTIATFNASTGALINPAFVSGLVNPVAIAVSGTNLFVLEADSNGPVIMRFNAETGASINSTLITGLIQPGWLAVSGDRLYVSSLLNDQNASSGIIGVYDFDGNAINPQLITGLTSPQFFQVESQAIPEPSTYALLAAGALLLLVARRRRG